MSDQAFFLQYKNGLNADMIKKIMFDNDYEDNALDIWDSCQMPTVLHIMPKRVSAHYSGVMLEVSRGFRHIIPALCRNFLKRRAWRADWASHQVPMEMEIMLFWMPKLCRPIQMSVANGYILGLKSGIISA